MVVYPKVFRVATYNFACLQSTTQSHFWGNIGDGNMGTLKKLVENLSYYYEMTQTCLPEKKICMKGYSELHTYFNTINYRSQATKWNHFEVSTHVRTT